MLCIIAGSNDLVDRSEQSSNRAPVHSKAFEDGAPNLSWAVFLGVFSRVAVGHSVSSSSATRSRAPPNGSDHFYDLSQLNLVRGGDLRYRSSGFVHTSYSRHSTLRRRNPVPHPIVALDMLVFLAALALSQDRPSPEWLPVLDAPKNLSKVLTIPPPAHAGQRMEIQGRVLKSDGRTPASGVIVYFHHTDGRGIYPRPSSSRPNEWIYWHGSIRGWLKSGADGSYVLKSTRPAAYPNGRTPAHIHAYGLLPGSKQGFTFQGILFAGDPLLTEKDRGIVRLVRDRNGVLKGSFDLVIPR